MNDKHDAGGGDHQQQGEDGENGGGAHTDSDDTSPSLVFLTRKACSLCERALPLVVAEAQRHGATLEVIDIDGTAWEAAYGDRVPVVVLDGAAVLAGRFGRREVRRALRSR